MTSFPNSSVPGPSGLRPSYLHEAMECPIPSQASTLSATLTKFVKLLAAGSASPSIFSHLCGATRLACRKKNRGHCPITFEEVLRRLVSKCLASITHYVAKHFLAPLQHGVSIKGGCEAIIHSVNRIMSSAPPDRQ